MSNVRKVAGYVKLAKLWERSRDKAIPLHHQYYEEKFAGADNFELVDVYIDITGKKEISKRPEMLRLMNDCLYGKVDTIAAQTKGYLAANPAEFTYLVKFLFDLEPRIDLITEDENYHIDTISNPDDQREALKSLADKVVSLDPAEYLLWLNNIRLSMMDLGME